MNQIQFIALKGFFLAVIVSLALVGAIEIWNKTVTGIVLRPWVARIEIEPGTDTYAKNDIENAGKQVRGILPGRNHK